MPRKSSAANAPKRSDGNVRRVIGANIKARRLALDWNQQDLADRFGVSRSAISQYEIGTGEVNAGDLPRLAKILGLTLLDFYQVTTREHLAAAHRVQGATFLEQWERGLLNEHNGEASGGTGGVGEADSEGAAENHGEAAYPLPIVFVPSKKGNTESASGSEQHDPGSGESVDQWISLADRAEMADLFADMTPLERQIVMRIARALKGTVGP